MEGGGELTEGDGVLPPGDASDGDGPRVVDAEEEDSDMTDGKERGTKAAEC